mmetsp:Transcript_75494/g.152707  ORF Transcript_75494/g.152707 Transcript_75494/m.152707 type:complete len:472 (+) Transcript_75494:89-1504(+)
MMQRLGFYKKDECSTHYKLGKTLGSGSFATVKAATRKADGTKWAVKIIAKQSLGPEDEEALKTEVAILQKVDHENIVALEQIFDCPKNFYMVMEKMTGGELFDRIVSKEKYTEDEARQVIRKIAEALKYCHDMGIVHRDLKPENFLFLSKDPIDQNQLKLIDFGLSSLMGNGKAMSTKAGTPYYVAPQVLQGSYNHSCDIWSCGVIMYTLLCGYPPFYGKTDQEVLQKVKSGNFTFENKDWRHISEDAKGLIRMLLKFDPMQRLTAEQALQHEWIRCRAPRATTVSLQAGIVDNLRAFQSQHKMKKAALHIIAGQLSEEKIKVLRQTFEALDANGDGLLTSQELKDGMAKANLEHAGLDLDALMEGIDADGSGLIDYTEFLAATLDKKCYMQEDVCYTAFSVFDQDGDGHITLEELKKILENGSVDQALHGRSSEEILKAVDTNGDGSIDFEEFMAMMRGDNAEAETRASF